MLPVSSTDDGSGIETNEKLNGAAGMSVPSRTCLHLNSSPNARQCSEAARTLKPVDIRDGVFTVVLVSGERRTCRVESVG
jgi:hypothetical protein